MDDLFGALVPIIGFLAAVVLGVWLIVNAVMYGSAAILFGCTNVIVAADHVLGMWPIGFPAASWGVNGFVCGALMYFAAIEAPRLQREGLRDAGVLAVPVWLIAVFIAGAPGPTRVATHTEPEPDASSPASTRQSANDTKPGIDPAPPSEPTQAATDGDQFSEQKLRSFAAAYTAVNDIAEEHSPELKSAQDSPQAEAVQAEVNALMESAIEAEGLTTREFNQVVRAVKEDSELSDKVARLLRKAQ